MGGSSSGLSSLDTRTTLGAAAPRRAAVRALRTGAGPLRRRSARFPRPRNRCVRLDHWVDTARPAPGKRNTGRSKYARPTAGRFTQAHFGPPPRRAAWMGRDSDGFWTAPPARCFTQLWKRRSHPRGSVALQAHGSVALSAHATDRIGAGNHLLSRQPPGSSRASPGHNHPLGQATTYWGRKIAYPNAQFPTPMPGPGAGGARSPVWRSKMRLSSRLERGLVERMVQNASESARIRPDPAQIAKLRRILDHPRAVPPGWGETQTDFGPPHPAQEASPSCGSGAPTPVVRWHSHPVVRWRFPRTQPIASGQATTY